jgi:uracil-DNA glycosylase family 4
MLQNENRIEQLARKYSELLKEYHPVVLGNGNMNAEIVMIGEAPGRFEIEQGQPFVGQAGKNLDEFLDVLGLRRQDLYVTNAVKFRPTKAGHTTARLSNRAPTAKEIELFRPMLMDEIAIVDPSIIVTLGNVPLFSLMGTKIKIGEVHGTIMEYSGKVLYPLYHPASIIYRRELEAVYRQDLMRLKEILQQRAILPTD